MHKTINSSIKTQFPIFAKYPELVYLDSAATTQKPKRVIEVIEQYYKTANANVHRGVHKLSDISTNHWSKARKTIASFFGATAEELIITRNTTEGINAVAYGWGERNLRAGDVILSSVMEHHANIVPWQQLCQRTGAQLKFIPVLPNGQLDYKWLMNNLNKQVKLVVVTYVSNVLGTVNDATRIIDLAHEMGARTLIDAAQAASRVKIDFNYLNADFLAFSGHKMYGPMGIGGLLVKKSLLTSGEFRPYLFGGGMIESVSLTETTFNQNLEERFTAGTPDVASLVGLAQACQFLSELTMSAVSSHDRKLTALAINQLSQLPEVELVGPTDATRMGSVAFLYHGVHAHDVAQILDSENIAVRSGHHCCMPLHTHFGWSATTRASFGVYNSPEDIDKLIEGLEKVKKVFG